MAKRIRPAPTPDELLAQFNPEMQALGNRLRRLIKAAVPEAIEAVYVGWKLIGYRAKVERKEVYFGFIAPFPDRVVIGFEWGVLLADPDRLLSGEGRQVRQVTMRQARDIKARALKRLIAAAVQAAALPRAEKGRRLLARDEGSTPTPASRPTRPRARQ